MNSLVGVRWIEEERETAFLWGNEAGMGVEGAGSGGFGRKYMRRYMARSLGFWE